MIKKKTHKNLYKQRLHVKKIKKVFKFNQIIFIIQYRNFQYRDVSYVQYRDVLIPIRSRKSKKNAAQWPEKDNDLQNIT